MSEKMTQSELNTFGHKIAAELGEGWTAEPETENHYRPRVHFNHSDGRRFSGHVDEYQHKGKIRFSHDLPRSKRENGGWVTLTRLSVPTIGCSYTRTAASIAADINRRFMPEFSAAWLDNAQLLRVEKAHMDAEAAAVALVESVAGIESRKANGGSGLYGSSSRIVDLVPWSGDHKARVLLGISQRSGKTKLAFEIRDVELEQGCDLIQMLKVALAGSQ